MYLRIITLALVSPGATEGQLIHTQSKKGFQIHIGCIFIPFYAHVSAEAFLSVNLKRLYLSVN